MAAYLVPAEESKRRLDSFIVEKLPPLSRAFVEKLIETGKVTVNDAMATKAGYRLRPNDMVTIDYSPEDSQSIPAIDLPILYEDEDCVVIDKPVGLLTHSKGGFNPEATVATWLKPRLKGLEGERAGIVHRLDRATSGVMICAKTPEALSWLQKQFSQRKVRKTYIALAQGGLKESEAIIDMPIERNPKHPKTFHTSSSGRPALTHYKVLKEVANLSLIRLQPTTGRTHQLRVHLSQLGHPILGDTLYGGNQAERLFLHALSLEITLPSRERQVFESKLPKEFESTVKHE